MPVQKFDFNKAASKARHDYPALTENVSFVDLSSPDAFMQLKEWYNREHNIPNEQLPQKGLIGWLSLIERKLFPDHPHAARFAHDRLRSDGFVLPKLLAMPSVLERSHMRLTGNSSDEKEALFTFYHELCHIVIPETPRLAIDPHVREIQADFFACTMGLRDGWLDIDDIKTLALNRGQSKDQDHNTQQALDSFISAYESGAYPERFAGWTAEDVRAFANNGKIVGKAAASKPKPKSP